MQPVDTALFATKGIEYILVLVFLGTLTLFWRVLNRPSRRIPIVEPRARTAGPGAWFATPNDVLYHQGHGWARPDDDALVTVGIDDFAQKLIGPAAAVRLPEIGDRVEQGAPGWSLTVGSTAIDQLSPIDGEVVDRNPAVLDSPELINRDPYGEGWLLKIRPSRAVANLTGLLRGSLAAAWMKEAEDALRERMSGELGTVLQDGGVPVSGIARALSPEDWDALAKEFLLTS